MLNLRREDGNKLRAYFCSAGTLCDTTGNGWILISDISDFTLSPDTPVQVGLYNDSPDGGAKVYSYVRINQIQDENDGDAIAKYAKTLEFGRDVSIKKVVVYGYIPDDGLFGLSLNNICFGEQPEGKPCQNSSLVVTPENLVTDHLDIAINLKSTKGELSAIPFIRSIQVFYEPF